MHALATDESCQNALKTFFFFGKVFVLRSNGNELVPSPLYDRTSTNILCAGLNIS